MNDTSFPLVSSTPQDWRRHAEQERLSRQLVDALRRVTHVATQLHDKSETRSERSRLSRIACRSDQHLREELQRQEGGHR